MQSVQVYSFQLMHSCTCSLSQPFWPCCKWFYFTKYHFAAKVLLDLNAITMYYQHSCMLLHI